MMLTERHFTLAWFISAALSVFLPLFTFTISRIANDQDNAYERNANENNNNQGANNNNNQYNNFYTQDQCKWWQWGCRDMYNSNYANQEQQQQAEDENELPWWWLWAEDERRPDDAPNPTLIVIYIWSLLLFAFLVYYGYRVKMNNSFDKSAIIMSLIVFAHLCAFGMLFIGGLEGAVLDEGPELDSHGFYGQFGVLVFTTYFWCCLFSVVFAYLIRRMASSSATTKIDISMDDYQAYEPKEVKATGKETA